MSDDQEGIRSGKGMGGNERGKETNRGQEIRGIRNCFQLYSQTGQHEFAKIGGETRVNLD